MMMDENNIITLEIIDGNTHATVKQDPIDLDYVRRFLLKIDGLERVIFMDPHSKLTSYSFLDGIAGIQRLHFTACPKKTNFSALESLPLLREVTTGNLCWFDCSILPKLPNLKIFRSGPFATCIKEISQCKSLERVELGGIKSPDCLFLADMPALSNLRLWDCKISSTAGLERCNQIRKLDLGQTSIADLDCLSYLPCLETLQLSRCKKIVDSSSIGHCVRLKFLNVAECKFLLDESTIRKLSNLETFIAYKFNLEAPVCQAILDSPNIKHISISKRFLGLFSGSAKEIKLTTIC